MLTNVKAIFDRSCWTAQDTQKDATLHRQLWKASRCSPIRPPRNRPQSICGYLLAHDHQLATYESPGDSHTRGSYSQIWRNLAGIQAEA